VLFFEGNWRSSRKTDKIYSCNDVSNGCYGGYEAGDKSCRDGYHGPLCGSCKHGNIIKIVFLNLHNYSISKALLFFFLF
jgi:hypothetical protein